MSLGGVEVVAFNEALGRAGTVSACMSLFKSLITPFGFDTYAAGEVDLDNRERVVFFALDWPPDWYKLYLALRVSERDPLLEALQYRREAFTWTELRIDRKLAQVGTRFLDLAAERGWTDGLVVPLARGGARFGLVSLVGRQQDLAAADKQALTLASTCFHARVRYLAPREGFPSPPFGLTGRELECLNHAADGLSDREIGERLAISTPTAHEYVEGSKRKLKARTRTQAVAIALCFGLLKL